MVSTMPSSKTRVVRSERRPGSFNRSVPCKFQMVMNGLVSNCVKFKEIGVDKTLAEYKVRTFFVIVLGEEMKWV